MGIFTPVHIKNLINTRDTQTHPHLRYHRSARGESVFGRLWLALFQTYLCISYHLISDDGWKFSLCTRKFTIPTHFESHSDRPLFRCLCVIRRHFNIVIIFGLHRHQPANRLNFATDSNDTHVRWRNKPSPFFHSKYFFRRSFFLSVSLHCLS